MKLKKNGVFTPIVVSQLNFKFYIEKIKTLTSRNLRSAEQSINVSLFFVYLFSIQFGECDCDGSYYILHLSWTPLSK